jgi:hypothetical protein
MRLLSTSAFFIKPTLKTESLQCKARMFCPFFDAIPDDKMPHALMRCLPMREYVHAKKLPMKVEMQSVHTWLHIGFR